MKKFISILLTFMIVMSFFVVGGTTVFAESSNLINEILQEQLDAIGDDDSISVWIWIYSKIDIKAIEQQALVETGLVGEELDTTEEINAFKKVRTRLISEFYTAENQAVLDKIGVAQENILFLSTLTPSFIVTLTKTQVYEVAQMEEIGSIDYYYEPEYEEPLDPPIEPEIPVVDGCKDLFIKKYGDPQFYEEIYWHYSDEGNTIKDWALISVATEIAVEPIENPTPDNFIVGDIVYSTIYINAPFRVPYCVYDVEKDEFIDILAVDFDEYDGLREVFCTSKYGEIIGDTDGDGVISITDATKIQRIIAELDELKNFYVADFNRDNKFSIIDATAIQRKLAELDEPVVNDEMVTVAIPKKQQWIPQEAISLPFEELYNEDQLYHRIYRDNMLGFADTFAIVKSKEQYYSLLNEDAPVFEDEFFENKWLLVSFLSMDGNGGYIRTADIAKSDNTLYSQLEVFVSASTTPPPPIMRWSLSMIAVDKKYLANVTDIVRVE